MGAAGSPSQLGARRISRTPLLIRQVRPVQLVQTASANPASIRSRMLPKPLGVSSLDQVHHLVNHDVFQARHRLLGQLRIQPDTPCFRVASAPSGLHPADPPVDHRDADPRMPTWRPSQGCAPGGWARYHLYSTASRASRPVEGRTRISIQALSRRRMPVGPVDTTTSNRYRRPSK